MQGSALLFLPLENLLTSRGMGHPISNKRDIRITHLLYFHSPKSLQSKQKNTCC